MIQYEPRRSPFDVAEEIVRARKIIKSKPLCGHSARHNGQVCPNKATSVIVVMAQPIFARPFVLLGGVCETCRQCAIKDGGQWPYSVEIHCEPLVLS